MLKSWLIVLVQLVLIAAILMTGPWWARHPAAWALEIAGLALGVWAIWSMRRSKLRATPDVADGARLIVSGPYRWIRHPMYTATLMVTGSLTANVFSAIRAFLWLGLLAVLVVKLTYEERLLARRFPEYSDYQRSTTRLIPFVW